MKQKINKYPVVFCVIYLLCALIFKKAVMVPVYHSNTTLLIQNMSELLILCVEIGITWIVIRKLDLLSRIPFRKKGIGKGMIWSIPGIMMVVLMLYLNIDGCFWQDIPLLGIYLIKNFSIGMMEELIIRGLFLTLLLVCWKEKKNGCYQAVFVSSSIFALGHLGNLLNDNINSVLAQVIYAFFLGVFFAVVTIRSKNIWPAIIVHSLIDVAGDIGTLIPVRETVTAVAAKEKEAFSLLKIISNAGILITIPLFLYAVILLVNYHKKEALVSKM